MAGQVAKVSATLMAKYGLTRDEPLSSTRVGIGAPAHEAGPGRSWSAPGFGRGGDRAKAAMSTHGRVGFEH